MSLSDHSLIYCIVKAGVPKGKPRTIEYRCYKSYDKEAFVNDLKNVPWSLIENESHVDDAINTWNILFSDVANSHAPLKTRRVKGTPIPWMTPELSVLMRDRDHHLKKVQKKKSSFHWDAYRKLRNIVFFCSL